MVGVDEATVEEVEVAARRWRFLLLVLLVLEADDVDFADEVGFADVVGAAVVLIFATAVEATGAPVIVVVVRTALGL